jgi:hypothetical protein
MTWIHNAGSNWDPLIEAYCKAHHIARTNDTTTHLDLQIRDIAIELKAEDLHQSLFTKGQIAGNLRWELQQYYLPLRARGELKEIWVFVCLTDKTSWRDIETLASLLFPHRIPHKLFESREMAVAAIDEAIQSTGQIIDLNYPPYINMSDELCVLFKMLRVFPGMTHDHIAEYASRYTIEFIEDQEPIIPAEFFDWFINDVCRHASTNLERLWYDFWNAGIEPRGNILGKGK